MKATLLEIGNGISLVATEDGLLITGANDWIGGRQSTPASPAASQFLATLPGLMSDELIERRDQV